MLVELLTKNKSSVLDKWVNSLFDTYHPDTKSFLKKQPDRFANPVGSTAANGLEKILDWLIGSPDSRSENLSLFLDDVVRIRAVQEFSASQAVSFVFSIKTIVRDMFGAEIKRSGFIDELLAFESRVDSVALLAFELYMECREKVFEIRATEIRNRTSRILERACQKYGMPHEW